MSVTEFREKVQPGKSLLVAGQEFIIEQVVTFKLEDGSSYIKCFLNDEYVFADDLSQNIYFLVRKVDTPFTQPFPNNVQFGAKDLTFLYEAQATAESVVGKEIYGRGETEHFWDYKAEDGSYLSLGIEDQTGERWDCYGRIVLPTEVSLTS